MISEIINSILPVFIIIFIGWLSMQLNIFDSSAKQVCATLVSSYVFPALLFMETATAKPDDILDVRWMSAFFLAMLSIWVISFASGKYIFKQSTKNGAMQSMLCAFPNMGGMGIPFLLHLIGSGALISVAKANFVVSLTLIPITILLLELKPSSSQKKSKIFIQAFMKSIRKPMFLAVVIGAFICFSGTNQYIPFVFSETIKSISKACIFVSLFAVGLALHNTKIRISKLFMFNLFIKSILSGFLAWVFVQIFNIHGNDAKELIFLLAMPTATIATILALQWNAQPEEATSMYLASTLLSIITLPVLIYLLN